MHTTWLVEHHVGLLLLHAKVTHAHVHSHAALTLTLTLALIHHIHLGLGLVSSAESTATANIHLRLVHFGTPKAVKGVIGIDMEQVPVLVNLGSFAVHLLFLLGDLGLILLERVEVEKTTSKVFLRRDNWCRWPVNRLLGRDTLKVSEQIVAWLLGGCHANTKWICRCLRLLLGCCRWHS